MESDVDSQIANFKRLIRTKYLSTAACTKPMDLAAGVQFYSLDAVTKIAFGEELGFLAADDDVDSFIQSFVVVVPFMALCNDIPLARNIFFNDFALKLMGPKYTDPTGMGKLMGFVCRSRVEGLWLLTHVYV